MSLLLPMVCMILDRVQYFCLLLTESKFDDELMSQERAIVFTVQ